MSNGWQVVAKYLGSNGRSIHTVERCGVAYKCTCHAFRIQKKGYCKHTQRAATGDRGELASPASVLGVVVLPPQTAPKQPERIYRSTKPPQKPQKPQVDTFKGPTQARRRIRFDDDT